MHIRSIALIFCVSALSVSVAHARRAPVTINKDAVDNINGYYEVQGSSAYCSNELLQHPDGTGSLCGYLSTCNDKVFVNGQHGKLVTFSWDRDARTIKPVRTTEKLQSVPGVTLDLCAPNNIDYGMSPVDPIPDAAFRYQNINRANLNHSPVRMVMTGFNVVDFSTLKVVWEGTTVRADTISGCESYPDLETKTCATFKYRQRTKAQRLSGTVAGSWTSDSFIDPLCKNPSLTGCTPRRFTVPVDFSPARATYTDATITETTIETTIEPYVNGRCSCPLVVL